MNIPTVLQQAIDTLILKQDISKIRDNVTNICSRYLYESGQGKKLVRTPDEVIAYVVARMPATYYAVYTALDYMCEQFDGQISSILDLGAGTGAVVWAVNEFFSLTRITCVERERYMIDIAKEMMCYGSDRMKNAEWIEASATSALQLEKSDLVTASYIMNELSENEKKVFLDNVWNNSNDVIMIIEPGTMVGFQNTLMAREFFLDKGANIIAPCTHCKTCELEKNDWCHFSCRLQRNKIQKYVKNGDAPYEDEKFSYVVVSKNKVEYKKSMRIVRHPIINKGYINLKVCSADGVRDVKITSKNKSSFKLFKKAKWGEAVNLVESAPLR